MTLLVRLFGVVVAGFGIVGIVMPELLVGAVRLVQFPPELHLVAALRVAVGLLLYFVAPVSRAPLVLRVLGVLIVVGGVLTPFFGTWGVQLVLDWWAAKGPLLVRAFGAAALLFGAFIVYSVAPRRTVAAP